MSKLPDPPLGPLARAVRAAYAAGEEDETMAPRVRVDSSGRPRGPIRPGDPVIFYDIRGEREVELSQALTDPGFPHFPVAGPVRLVTMIEYAPGLVPPGGVAFPPEERLQDTLGEVVSRAGLFQVKVVESEKAIHLGYFLSGKREGIFPGEERRVIESLKDVKNYDERPEMRAAEVADQTIAALRNPRFSLIVANFANVDVVGHIENRPAVLQAVAAVDRELGRVIEAARASGVSVLLTADHGTVEQWLYPEGAVDTGHTQNPVPCLLIDPELEKQGIKLRAGGSLIDVAPTVLELLALPKPAAMTGVSLVEGLRGPISRRRVLLLIADGWGYREETYGNLILEADTPVMDRLRREHPFTALLAAGEAVGLPPGTVGNSEAGHLHLGAGRVIYSDRLRIDRALQDDSYFQNPAFLHAMQIAKKEDRPLHLLGIVSFFSSHGSLDHLFALMQMAKDQGVKRMFIHSLLGRRGERPAAGAHYIAKVEAECARLGLGEVVTVMGRFWALDREQNWDRVEKAYRALVEGIGTLAR